MNYSIAAIPTEYKGRTYRSRLEGRWAAFFDRLGLVAEYEPFDLGAWSPDFLLIDLNTLVEVKPIIEFDAETWVKMIRACEARSFEGWILLTRLAPVVDKIVNPGWIGMFQPGQTWSDKSPERRAGIGWYPHCTEPRFVSDLVCLNEHGVFSASGSQVGFDDFPKINIRDADLWPQSYTEHTMKIWDAACRDVQYQP